MFDAPVDAWYVWIGLGFASLAVLATTLALGSTAPTGAARVAGVVDEVASSPHRAVETVRLDAREVRLGTSRLALKTGAGVAHATVDFGPVTPVGGGRLGAVLDGRPVSEVFATRGAFERAVERARERAGAWRPAPSRLTVRRVSWGNVDATLVG